MRFGLVQAGRALLAAAALLLGCSHEVESPGVTLTSLDPDLLCNAQRLDPRAEIVIHGDGMTPMPAQALDPPVALVLPTIEIAKSAGLDGTAETAAPVVFPGDPRLKDPLTGNATWQSAQQMTFAVTEADEARGVAHVDLDPGLWDVKVTNPDKTHSWTLGRGLAVIPPPKVTGLDPVPPVLCTDQEDRTLIVQGESFLKLDDALPRVTLTADGGSPEEFTPDSADGCEPVGEYAGGQVELCTSLTLTLAKGRLDPGAYEIVVTSQAPGEDSFVECASSEPVIVAIVPPPLVTGLVPPAICVDQEDQQITVEGGSFIHIGAAEPKITVTGSDGTEYEYDPDALTGCAPIEGIDPSHDAETCGGMTFTVPQGDLPPGAYTVTVTNPSPAGCSSTETITLTVAPPPRVDAVVPATVCSGGSVVGIDGSGFQDGASVALECPGGATVSASSVGVSADGTHIDATFGPGINPGDDCEVVVTNPDGCQDRPLPHQRVTGTEGPILFFVDPRVAYNGISTRITIYVTAVTGNVNAVTIVPTGQPGPVTTLTVTQVAGNRIQAIVPAGQAPGTYDVSVNDDSGCLATLLGGLEVVDQLTLTITAITPPFGLATEFVPVQITGSGFAPTPRVFLNPATGTDPATQLEGASFVDASQINAVVSPAIALGTYDLVVVNPGGEVGVLEDAYQALGTAPPVITDLTPQSIENGAGQTIDVTGTGFSGASVSIDCKNLDGTDAADPTITSQSCDATSCTVTMDATAVPNGAVCVVRVTNADGSWGEFSALGVTNPSLNLRNPVAGSAMNTGRRALFSAAVRANSVSRFVYAIGGDGGQAQAGSPFSSVEFVGVDLFGQMKSWTNNRASLGTARAFHGGARVGRYVYVFGGTDGTQDLTSAERALSLSPAEIPHMAVADLCLSGGSSDCFNVAGIGDGLEAGEYSYRVAASIDPADPVNLGGDTLASDPVILKLPSIQNRKISVKLEWTAPRDALGVELSGIAGYKLYRTPKDGTAGQDEVLLATLPTTPPLEYIDDGTATLGTESPLPNGSTSAWQALPSLGTPRRGLAGGAAPDPATADQWHVYALLGQGEASYEHLTVTVQPNGRQTVGAAWTVGSQDASVARHDFGAWVVDSKTTPIVSAPDVWIFLGGGRTIGGGGNTGLVEAATVQAGGDLGAWNPLPDDFSSDRGGYAAFVVSTKLFAFGGASLPGNAPRDNAIGGEMQAPMPTIANWNNEGLQMSTARHLLGSSIESAFVFLIGGEATVGGAALTSSESLAW